MNEHLDKYEKTFLGGCFGVGLYKRGPNDPHVCFIVLVEDDGNWFENKNGGSSFWLKDLQEQLNDAIIWIEQNCDPDIKDGNNWGWKFKENKQRTLGEE